MKSPIHRWFIGLVVAAAVVSLSTPAMSEEPRVPNPYRNLMYEDPLDRPDSRLVAPAWLEFAGAFRLRGRYEGNLDLGRGITPTAHKTIVGTSPGAGGDFSSADLRFLVETRFNLGPEVSIRCRLSVLDNLVLGSTPVSYPAAAGTPMAAGSTTQVSPVRGINSLNDAIGIHTLSLEWLSPIGLIIAGRTAGDWGLGMVANSGTCPDCDQLQSVDRLAYVTSLFGALVAVSFDLDANGGHAGTYENPAGVARDLTDDDDLRTINLAVTRYSLPSIAARQIEAGKTLFNWGVALSYRWQDLELPGYYFTAAGRWQGDAATDEYVQRDLDAVLVDGWFRVAGRTWLVEGEAAYMYARMGSVSMLAGVTTTAVTASQWGGVLRGKWRPASGRVTIGGEFGIASGDDAFGFGARPGSNAAPQAGDMDGLQFNLAAARPDNTINNFRFSPNFHVDELLWRRIIGTVTDGLYGKVSMRYRPADWFFAELAEIYSRALYAQSTPGIAKNLGLETNLLLGFEVADGMRFKLVGAFLYPLDGFRNLNTIPETGSTPAWLVRAAVEAEF